MLDAGIILKSMSPWTKLYGSSEKYTPEGSPQPFCLCINYRKLNSLLPSITPAMCTKKGAFTLMHLPKIDELFTLLKGAKYFTALDLCSGYNHIILDEGAIPKSVFTTVFGKFEFMRLPFSLSQGPDFFIHLIYDLFGLDKTSNQSQGFGYLAYLDDILIFAKLRKNTYRCHTVILHACAGPVSKWNWANAYSSRNKFIT